MQSNLQTNIISLLMKTQTTGPSVMRAAVWASVSCCKVTARPLTFPLVAGRRKQRPAALQRLQSPGECSSTSVCVINRGRCVTMSHSLNLPVWNVGSEHLHTQLEASNTGCSPQNTLKCSRSIILMSNQVFVLLRDLAALPAVVLLMS